MRFMVLDAWRGVAALTIALYRFNADGWFFDLGIVRNSYLLVDFFFVLSGFVIAFAYTDRLASSGDVGRFVVRRFGRVWPLHFFMLLVFILWEIAQRVFGLDTSPAFQGPQSPDSILANLFLVQSVGLLPYLGWNFPAWSISTEFWTYCLFAAVCFASRQTLPWIAAFFVAGGLAVVMANSNEGMSVTSDFGIFRCIAGFFAGVLVHRLWSATSTLGFGRLATPLEVLAVGLTIAFVSLAGTTALSFAAPVAFAGLVYVFAYQSGALSRLLMTKPFQLLGEWSYSIYMVALLVSIISFKALATIFGQMTDTAVKTIVVGGHEKEVLAFVPGGLMDLVAVGYLAVVCAVACLTFRFVETPGREFFNRLVDGRRPAVVRL